MAGLQMFQVLKLSSFYPKDGVSKVQELQMTTQTGENTHVNRYLMETFDDAQTNVKHIVQ